MVLWEHVNELSMEIPLEESLNYATALLSQLERISDSLPKSVRNVIDGQSLAMTRHVSESKQKGINYSDLSSMYDYSPTLLNEELEVLMDNEMYECMNLTP
uniref:Uncharacterized protein n=1 Tax=Trichobilharzia regenti TaxID=157069 RepID=A0AA85JKN9_TRIRE|nr:unnamed protein product [Trichobilharzia regenti]